MIRSIMYKHFSDASVCVSVCVGRLGWVRCRMHHFWNFGNVEFMCFVSVDLILEDHKLQSQTCVLSGFNRVPTETTCRMI